MKKYNYHLILGSSKSIGLELTKNLLKNKNNFVIGVSRSSNKIEHSNYIEINCDLYKYSSYKKIIDHLNKNKIKYINNILISIRDRSNIKNNLEREFKILIFNPLKFMNSLKEYNFFNFKNTNSVVFIGSALDSSLSSFANINYLLPRQSLKYFIESMAYDHKDINLRFFCLSPFIFVKEENKKNLTLNNDLVKKINKYSNYKLISSNEISEIIKFLFSNKSNLLNGQTITIDGNVLKRLK